MYEISTQTTTARKRGCNYHGLHIPISSTPPSLKINITYVKPVISTIQIGRAKKGCFCALGYQINVNQNW